MSRSDTRLSKAYIISLYALPVLFYMAYWLVDGAVWCADSISYVTMYDSREPLYPVLLAVFRRIIGVSESLPMEEQPYLFRVAGLQCLLAGISVGAMASYPVRRLKLKLSTGYVIVMIPILVSLLNRYAAKRGSMYSNSILTEGITISIYMLFIRFLYEYICTDSRSACIWSVVLAVLGISARKQMYVLAGLLVIVLIFKAVRRGKAAVKGLIAAVILTAAVPMLFDCTYNYFLRGSFIRHTEDNRFITTIALYNAEREYSEYITPELRDIYLEIYDACDEGGYTYRYEPEGWMNAVEHFGGNYDHIQLDTMEVILERVADHTGYEPVDRCATHSARMDAIRKEFNSALLPHETGRLLRLFAMNFMSGMILTVARVNPVLCVYSVVFYAVYTAFMVFLCIRGLGKKNRLQLDSGIFGGLILLSTLLNTALVSAVIFCQTRYTIYNFPLIYMALVCMAVACGKNLNDKTSSQMSAGNEKKSSEA